MFYFFTLGLSISIFESISLGHNEGGTGINSKRECGGSMSDGCNQGTSYSN